jgi:hypothetical protein
MRRDFPVVRLYGFLRVGFLASTIRTGGWLPSLRAFVPPVGGDSRAVSSSAPPPTKASTGCLDDRAAPMEVRPTHSGTHSGRTR